VKGGIVIETARLGDVPAIHGIEQASFPSPWRREFFESEVAAGHRLNLVARRGGVIVGYLFAMWLFDEMHVNKIAVIEEERRKGIADLLMARCFEFAHEHDVHMISLEVRKSNVGAQEFYRRLEFHFSYTRPRYYPDGEAAVVMTRKL
jgi:[ribosomal protein S18]-alanine N-acetyltransferase